MYETEEKKNTETFFFYEKCEWRSECCTKHGWNKKKRREVEICTLLFKCHSQINYLIFKTVRRTVAAVRIRIVVAAADVLSSSAGRKINKRFSHSRILTAHKTKTIYIYINKNFVLRKNALEQERERERLSKNNKEPTNKQPKKM